MSEEPRPFKASGRTLLAAAGNAELHNGDGGSCLHQAASIVYYRIGMQMALPATSPVLPTYLTFTVTFLPHTMGSWSSYHYPSAQAAGLSQ